MHSGIIIQETESWSNFAVNLKFRLIVRMIVSKVGYLRVVLGFLTKIIEVRLASSPGKPRSN